MNARAVKRRVLRMRRVSFWGPRAYVSLRVPMSIYPEPCPVFVLPLGWKREGVLAGYWLVEEDETKKRVASISFVSSGTHPEKNGPRDRSVHFVTKTGEWTDAKGECHSSWSWWEGEIVMISKRMNIEGKEIQERVASEPLSEEVIAAYRNEYRWYSRYIHRMERFPGDEGREFLARLGDVQSWARATYGDVKGDSVILTYAVKWFYPNRLAGFCASLGRALKQAKREGIKVKLLGG